MNAVVALIGLRKLGFNSLAFLKCLGLILTIVVAISVISSASKWSERRGVFDDIGYLRQAHLFQRFGFSGIDTDLNRDDDNYYKDAATAIRSIEWNDPNVPFAHTFINKTGKTVIQYPPGTGALLALFPEGRQVFGLYSFSCLIVLAIAITLIASATNEVQAIVCSLFGSATVYFFVNPIKASYSVAPSAAMCAVLGAITPILFDDKISKYWRLSTFAFAGLLLGFLIDLRIPNFLLTAGYAVVIAALAIRQRTGTLFAGCSVMLVGFLIGVAPTLAANAINAGSVFQTTYGVQDTHLPELVWGPAAYYMTDLQGILLIFALVGSAVVFSHSRKRCALAAAIVAFLTSSLSAMFFFTHSLVTQYYLMPAVLLSLWITVWLIVGEPLFGRRVVRS